MYTIVYAMILTLCLGNSCFSSIVITGIIKIIHYSSIYIGIDISIIVIIKSTIINNTIIIVSNIIIIIINESAIETHIKSVLHIIIIIISM